MKRLLSLSLALAAVAIAHAQTPLDPAKLLKPGTDSWPSYNGDYTGRRYSTLNKINTSNIDALSLAWVYRVNTGGQGGPTTIKGTPIVIDGIMYVTVPDHVWAVDARTGRQIWHHGWTSKGGIHIGNRGVAVLNDTLYYETPDCQLVALSIKDGSEKWHKEICDLEQFYYGSVAPMVVKNHIIAGVSGDDLDIPGYLDARDPVTGDLQWRWYAVPQKPGDPGYDTWPNEEAAKHGGGMTWQPITYDPDLNLIYVTTGNPQPVIAFKNREGANLFTASVVALNADTGKMVWYFQSSPNDTHDWDATQPAVLIDGDFNGQPRKMVALGARNGHFFLLDRTNGKALVSSDYAGTNWAKGYDEKGQPIPDPAKRPHVDGVIVSPDQGGAANWPPQSYSPDTGLLYVPASRAFSIFYIYDPGENPQGWGGTDRGGWSESMLQAIDIRTGKLRWSHKWESAARAGILTTAGNLLFTGGNSGDLVALNATTGDALWHARLGTSVSNGPITYEMDGLQYVVAAAGDQLFTFVMRAK